MYLPNRIFFDGNKTSTKTNHHKNIIFDLFKTGISENKILEYFET